MTKPEVVLLSTYDENAADPEQVQYILIDGTVVLRISETEERIEPMESAACVLSSLHQLGLITFKEEHREKL